MNYSISIIIPTRNRAKFLMEALESVHSQTRKPLEVIVVDDGSTDDTKTILSGSHFKVKYMYQRKNGPAAARNAGIASARGDIIAFLDDDDVLEPDALELCVKQLEKKKTFGVDVVLGVVTRVENVKSVNGKLTYKKVLQNWSDRILCSGVFQKKVFDKVGLFDESFLLQSDAEWFLRAREKDIRFSLLEGKPTHLHRIHTTNITKDKTGAKLFLLRAIRQSLSRREGKGAGAVVPLKELSDFLY